MQEQVLRRGRRGARVRPFCLLARVQPRGYSRPLQRALSDFGAEESFGRAALRLKEHYGIEVSVSATRRITYRHARAMAQVAPAKPVKAPQTLITEMDGSMVPLVECAPGADRRRHKSVSWHEVRVCCARAEGAVTRVYGATLGSLENASLLWLETARHAGLEERTFVHGLGDGAPWIVEKFKDNFGAQGRYLIDFFHVSEYLAAAAPQIAGPKKAAKWLHKQKDRLVLGQTRKVLRSLHPHQEGPGATETPVADASRYIGQRLSHLHYAEALKKALPIGSGEVESAHRHLVQQRLKIAGAWWKQTNAQAMLNLRVCRANNCWDAYWAQN